MMLLVCYYALGGWERIKGDLEEGKSHPVNLRKTELPRGVKEASSEEGSVSFYFSFTFKDLPNSLMS